MRGLAAIATLVSILGAATVGCGVKGVPIPPEAAVPERIADLDAFSDKDGIRLSWGRPFRYSGGRKLRDLGSFEIDRAEGSGAPRVIAKIPVTDQERFQQQRSFDYLDANTQIGHSYRYTVIAETFDGYRSPPSNEAQAFRSAQPAPANPETYTLPTPTPLP
ncbi:MAG TPA: hypothetical protein VEF03_08820 [Candidatus Binataceae bacterium]|nr:hypothetical protein [Candidatus Binataceae bacterium]